MLLGRRGECTSLERLLVAVRAGQSRALVLRGEAGVGKTALLEYLVEQASDCLVARAAGVQSEMELAFAGLHQLCAPMLTRLDRLPGPQRDALRTAFGLSAGDPPDRFLVSLAALGLLAEMAQERPLVCVVDDVQWLDRASAQVLAFVARRLVAESVALVFAVRETDEVTELAGLPALVVGGLPDDAARALLRSVVRGPVDDHMLDRVVAETRGNPLALLELPRGLTPVELSAGFGLPGTRALPDRIEESYRRRLNQLADATQQLLLVAAAEPLWDPVLVWRAAEQLGVGVDAAAPAAEAGLLEIGAQVRFLHPLVRSAIYWAASAEQRRGAHHALAQATDPERDPDRRAWHQAHAAAGPDEDVAADLERSAGRAQARGGLAAAAAFLQRAAELTPEPTRRGERALAAAYAAHQAGATDAALKLLALAEAGPLIKVQRAQVDLLRAQIAFAANRGRDAAPLLLKAAKQLEPLDAKLARDTYLDALFAAMFAGGLASGGGVREVAEAARAAPAPSQPPRAADLLLDGLAVRFTDGDAAGAPTLRLALNAFRGSELSAEEGLRWLWLAGITARDLGEDEAWEVLATRHVELAREAGALTMLPFALNSRINAHALAGELTEAASLLEELAAVTEATGIPLAPHGALMLAAWQGHDAELDELIEATTNEMLRRGEGIVLTFARWARAVLYNALGRYKDALAPATRASGELSQEMSMLTRGSLVELIEAASRSGKIESAADALRRLTQLAHASGTDWALGLETRSRALLSDGSAAENAYREAIDRLRRTRIRGELARAHLVYGEWLRRQRRRLDARDQLRTAYDMFTTMGAEAFAQRAASELQATGETARKRTVETSSELTAQEAQVVRLVREGLSNQEAGARLFISPRTVKYHLRKVFIKLDITSRTQLDHVLPSDPSTLR
jgi:DNA-binding CsgD family transcriptional regulator